MKILHVIDSLATGGAETLTVGLAKDAIRRGHDAKIAVLAQRPGIPLDSANQHGISVVTLGRNFKDPLILKNLRALVREYDVVHAHLFPAFYFTSFAGKKTPKILTEHSTTNQRRSLALMRPLEKQVYKNFDAVVAISPGVAEATAKYFQQLGLSKKISTIANGIESQFFSGAEKQHSREAVSVVAVGSLKKIKNFQAAIDAFAHLPEQFTLDIIGTGPDAAPLREQIETLKLTHRVRLLGPKSDLHTLYTQYDAILSTSLWEGFGLTLVEGMAAGLPVVAPNIAGIDSIITDGRSGFLYDTSKYAQGIEQSLRKLLDPATRDSMGNFAFSEAQKYRIELTSQYYLELYESLI